MLGQTHPGRVRFREDSSRSALLHYLASRGTTSTTTGQWSEPIRAARLNALTDRSRDTSTWSIGIPAAPSITGQVGCQPKPSDADLSPLAPSMLRKCGEYGVILKSPSTTSGACVAWA